MPTARELYDVERSRAVKNITLLKTLKAKIVEENSVTTQMANITREIHQAESEEEWNRYKQLNSSLPNSRNKRIPQTHQVQSSPQLKKTSELKNAQQGQPSTQMKITQQLLSTSNLSCLLLHPTVRMTYSRSTI